jgi:hypothetical protein
MIQNQDELRRANIKSMSIENNHQCVSKIVSFKMQIK